MTTLKLPDEVLSVSVGTGKDSASYAADANGFVDVKNENHVREIMAHDPRVERGKRSEQSAERPFEADEVKGPKPVEDMTRAEMAQELAEAGVAVPKDMLAAKMRSIVTDTRAAKAVL